MTRYRHKYGVHYGEDYHMYMIKLPYVYEPAHEYWVCLSFVGAI